MSENKNNNLTQNEIEEIESELDSAKMQIEIIENFRTTDEDKYKHSLKFLPHFHMVYGKYRYLLDNSIENFSESVKSACSFYPHCLEETNPHHKNSDIFLEKEAGIYFLLSYFYGEKIRQKY
jgi:hypothetical protein